jgi:hypothetical protein
MNDFCFKSLDSIEFVYIANLTLSADLYKKMDLFDFITHFNAIDKTRYYGSMPTFVGHYSAIVKNSDIEISHLLRHTEVTKFLQLVYGKPIIP